MEHFSPKRNPTNQKEETYNSGVMFSFSAIANKVGITRNKNIFLLGIVALGTLGLYLWFIRQPIFQVFIDWGQQSLLLYITILTLLKALALLWPPLPGGLLTLGSIPVIGWFYAALADIIGSLIGASLAFLIAKRYGYWFLQKILDQRIIEKIRNFKIAKHKEFEAIFFLRLFTGVISEVVSYGCGIVGIRYRNFVFATFLASLLDLPLFYLASNVFAGENIFLNIALIIIFGFIFWRLKGRYFE